ncbi:MAG: hypothetical protein GX616_20360 [Planctomycetes bacterium]|nr:hypothetical protein [Planctomycetota bacterium]
MKLLCLIVACFSLSGPRIERASPPGGGTSWWRNHDLSFVVGEFSRWDAAKQAHVDERIWVWTPQTGTLFLDQIVECPSGSRVITVCWTDDDYRMLLRVLPSTVSADWWLSGEYVEHIVTLPKDPRDWFQPADFDRDGDVDQTDFGLLQARLGRRDEAAYDLNRDGHVTIADIDTFKSLLTGQ